MIVTNELKAICALENTHIAELKTLLKPTGVSMSDKAEQAIRSGYYNEALIKLAIQRHSEGLDPVSGEKR